MYIYIFKFSEAALMLFSQALPDFQVEFKKKKKQIFVNSNIKKDIIIISFSCLLFNMTVLKIH